MNSRRRWFQFNLRSLLLATLVAAAAAWWFFRPSPPEITLPGGLRLQVASLTSGESSKEDQGPKLPSGNLSVQQQSQSRGVLQERWEHFHGPLRVLDKYGRVLCRGEVDHGQASGRWTYYHLNGRKAMRGVCSSGCRIGTWRAWHKNGVRLFEIEYGPPRLGAQEIRGLTSASIDQLQKWLEPVSHSGGWQSAYGSWDGWLQHRDRLLLRHQRTLDEALGISSSENRDQFYLSRREGASRTWWANGQRRSQGGFHHDRRHGVWKSWNRKGTKVAEGTYRQGVRHGRWRFWSTATAPPSIVFFMFGIRRTEGESLSRLNEKLDSDVWRERVLAVQLLCLHGQPGIQVLQQRLTSSENGALVKVILRRLRQLGPAANVATSAVAELEKSDSSLRALARQCRFAIDVTGRAKLVDMMLAECRGAPWKAQQSKFSEIAQLGPGIVTHLTRCLDVADSPSERRSVFRAIAAVGLKAPQEETHVLQLLKKLVNDKDRAIAKSAGQLRRHLRPPW